MLAKIKKSNRRNIGIRVNHNCNGSNCLKAMYSTGISMNTGLNRIAG